MTWREQAACLGQDDLMFDLERVEEALVLCRRCTVFWECSDLLPTMEGMVGVFAGHVFKPKGRPRLGRQFRNRLPRQICPMCKEEFQLRHRRQLLCSSDCRIDLAAITELAATLDKLLPVAVRRSA